MAAMTVLLSHDHPDAPDIIGGCSTVSNTVSRMAPPRLRLLVLPRPQHAHDQRSQRLG
jgi:hypothetical protein